jgi:hypothetical protein
MVGGGGDGGGIWFPRATEETARDDGILPLHRNYIAGGPDGSTGINAEALPGP